MTIILTVVCMSVFPWLWHKAVPLPATLVLENKTRGDIA
jgi:hypothetical protein